VTTIRTDPETFSNALALLARAWDRAKRNEGNPRRVDAWRDYKWAMRFIGNIRNTNPSKEA
jgi:hypothetical protein